MQYSSNQQTVAEFLATFALVFFGCGAIVINDLSPSHPVTHVGISITFGLTVLAMIYAMGEISGAHLNPAVTLGFFLANRMKTGLALRFVFAQTTGALFAAATLKMLFPQHTSLGSTIPTGSEFQSFVLEIILSSVLMLVIFRVATGSKEKGLTAGIVVGSVIALEALCAGPISGASMNPARSFAPAVVSQQFQSLWVYCTAPFLGAAISVPLASFLSSGSDSVTDE